MTNAPAVAAVLRKFGAALPRNTARALDIWSRRTATEIKRVAPTGRTRNLRRSVYGRGFLRGGRPVGLIVAPVRYAPFVEFGTRRRFVAPVRRKALRWIGKGIKGYAFSRGHFVGPSKAHNFFFATARKFYDQIAATVWRLCSAPLRIKA